MSLKVASVERQEILDLASLSIESAARHGVLIQADMEAFRLLDEHPDCHMPFEELRDAISRLAVASGVGLEVASASPFPVIQ